MTIETISLENHWKAVCQGEPLLTSGNFDFFGWHQNPESSEIDLRAYYRDWVFGQGHALTFDEVQSLLKIDSTDDLFYASQRKIGEIMIEHYNPLRPS